MPKSSRPIRSSGKNHNCYDINYFYEEYRSFKMRLTFIRDSLCSIRVNGGWSSDGADKIRDGFTAKYGDGVKGDPGLYYHHKGGICYSLVWTSETARAFYMITDDQNPDSDSRRILEYIEVTPIGRNIEHEVDSIEALGKAVKASQELENIKNAI